MQASRPADEARHESENPVHESEAGVAEDDEESPVNERAGGDGEDDEAHDLG